MYTLLELKEKTLGELKQIGYKLNVLPKGDRRLRQNWIDAIAGVKPPLLQLLEVSPAASVEQVPPIIETAEKPSVLEFELVQESLEITPLREKEGFRECQTCEDGLVIDRWGDPVACPYCGGSQWVIDTEDDGFQWVNIEDVESQAQEPIAQATENSPGVDPGADVARGQEPIIETVEAFPGADVDRVQEPIIETAEKPSVLEFELVQESLEITPLREENGFRECLNCEDGFVTDRWGDIVECPRCDGSQWVNIEDVESQAQEPIAQATENSPGVDPGADVYRTQEPIIETVEAFPGADVDQALSHKFLLCLKEGHNTLWYDGKNFVCEKWSAKTYCKRGVGSAKHQLRCHPEVKRLGNLQVVENSPADQKPIEVQATEPIVQEGENSPDFYVEELIQEPLAESAPGATDCPFCDATHALFTTRDHLDRLVIRCLHCTYSRPKNYPGAIQTLAQESKSGRAFYPCPIQKPSKNGEARLQLNRNESADLYNCGFHSTKSDRNSSSAKTEALGSQKGDRVLAVAENDQAGRGPALPNQPVELNFTEFQVGDLVKDKSLTWGLEKKSLTGMVILVHSSCSGGVRVDFGSGGTFDYFGSRLKNLISFERCQELIAQAAENARGVDPDRRQEAIVQEAENTGKVQEYRFLLSLNDEGGNTLWYDGKNFVSERWSAKFYTKRGVGLAKHQLRFHPEVRRALSFGNVLQVVENSPGVGVAQAQGAIEQVVENSPCVGVAQAQGAIEQVVENSPGVGVAQAQGAIEQVVENSPGVGVAQAQGAIERVVEASPGVEVEPECVECFDDGFVEDEFGYVKICQCYNEPKLRDQKTQSAIASGAKTSLNPKPDLNPILTGVTFSDRFLARYAPPQTQIIHFSSDADGQLSLLNFEVESVDEPPDPDDFESLDAFRESMARWDWEHLSTFDYCSDLPNSVHSEPSSVQNEPSSVQNELPLQVSLDSFCLWAHCPDDWYEPNEPSPVSKSSITSDFFIPTFGLGDRFNGSDEPPDTGIFARYPKPKPPMFPPQAVSWTKVGHKLDTGQPKSAQVRHPETIPKLFHRAAGSNTQPARSPPGGDAA